MDDYVSYEKLLDAAWEMKINYELDESVEKIIERIVAFRTEKGENSDASSCQTW